MSPRKAAPPPMLTVAQAAERLGLERGQVYKLIRSRRIAHIRHDSTGDGPGPIRVEAAEIDRYLKDHRVPAAT